MSKRAMAPIEDHRLRVDDSLERLFRIDDDRPMTAADVARLLRSLDRMTEDEVSMALRKAVKPNDEEDDDRHTEEDDDRDSEDVEDDDDDDGEDDHKKGGEDDDRAEEAEAMRDAYILRGYRVSR